MNQLEPGRYFAIVRQLADPNDSGTYFVRAEIRNAETDDLIERVTLTDRGSRRFSYRWQTVANGVPSDGLYISILTSVFTDAGFTTPSDVYGDEMETYLVKSMQTHIGGYLGGGSSVNYDKISEILGGHMQNVPRETLNLDPLLRALGAIAKQQSNDSEAILTAIAGVQTAVTSLKFPESEPVDLQPVLNSIAQIVIPETNLEPVLEAILAIKFPETDLTPILEAVKKEIGTGKATHKNNVTTIAKAFATALEADVQADDGNEPSPLPLREVMRGLRKKP